MSDVLKPGARVRGLTGAMLEALRRLHRGIDLDADLPVPMVTLEALYARRLVYAPPPGYRHDFMLTPAGVSMVLETDHVRLQSMYLDGIRYFLDVRQTHPSHRSNRVANFPQLLAKVSALALQERMSK